GHNREKDEQDEAYRDVARGSYVALGHGSQVIGVADQRNAPIQLLASKRHVRERTALKSRYIDAAFKGVGSHQTRIGMVFDEIILGRHCKHEAVLVDSDVLERTC